MPYKSNSDLPDKIKNHLPEHAQDIFRETFNSAHKYYPDDETRCFKIAWASVKKQYEKDNDTGNYRKKDKI